MFKIETNSTNETQLVNQKLNTASNVLNIISFVGALALLIVIIILSIYYNKKLSKILENEHILSFFCSAIPSLLAIALKFVFGIINDRNILQSKIVKNGLLFFILNILLLLVGIVLFIVFNVFGDDQLKDLFKFLKTLYFIISLLCLVVAIFTIVDRIRGKNKIHLFFLIFYTIVIAINCVSSVLFLISIYKDEKKASGALKEDINSAHSGASKGDSGLNIPFGE